MTEPEVGKTNPRRAIIVTLVFLFLLGCVIISLRSYGNYLRLRFVGGDKAFISYALEAESISAGQVVALVNSGATYEVRLGALRAMSESAKFKRPLPDSAVLAITKFRRDLPTDLIKRADVSVAIAKIALGSSRGEVQTLLNALAADPNPVVRLCVAMELTTRGGPEWAVPVLHTLLSDTDPRVRVAALSAIRGFHVTGATVSSLLPSVRGMLRSSTETEHVRLQALITLSLCDQLDEEQIAPYLADTHRSVAAAAKHIHDDLLRWRSNCVGDNDGKRAPSNPTDGRAEINPK